MGVEDFNHKYVIPRAEVFTLNCIPQEEFPSLYYTFSPDDKLEKGEEESLFNLLRNVSLVGNIEIKPYKDARMEIVQINPNEVNPSSYYVLEDNLKTVRGILSMGIDLFNLNEVHQSGSNILLLPILEEHIINGKPQLILIDGQHRLFVAREKGIELVTVIVIRDCVIPCPVLPLEGWDVVEIVSEVPENKREYNPDISLEEVSGYYRRLPGSSGERRAHPASL